MEVQPVLTGVRGGFSVVAPTCGLTNDCAVNLGHSPLVHICSIRVRQHSAIEEVTVYMVCKAQAILSVTLELVMNIVWAFCDLVVSLNSMLSIPGMESPPAGRMIAMGSVPVLLGPIVVSAEPVGKQVRDEIVNVQLLTKCLVFGEIGRIGLHGARSADHSVVIRTGAAAGTVVDNTAGIVLDGVVLFFVSTERLCRPGMVRPFMDVVHSPVQLVNIDVGIGAMR
ncbi:hypothetical protein ES703_48515 [subsurface metagenome]